jgi:hypothetical protein
MLDVSKCKSVRGAGAWELGRNGVEVRQKGVDALEMPKVLNEVE